MKICIIGAGASGMMAALAASEQKTNIVTVFERQQRAGKKLSVTGNGRCNLTNTNASVAYYHGQSPEFAAFALSSFGPEDVRTYFKKLGLLTTEEYGGRVYRIPRKRRTLENASCTNLSGNHARGDHHLVPAAEKTSL